MSGPDDDQDASETASRAERNESRGLEWLGFFARFTLLLISMLAIATLAVWNWAPEKIAAVDTALIGRYERPYREKLEQARQALESGNREEAHSILNDLLEQLSDAREGEPFYLSDDNDLARRRLR